RHVGRNSGCLHPCSCEGLAFAFSPSADIARPSPDRDRICLGASSQTSRHFLPRTRAAPRVSLADVSRTESIPVQRVFLGTRAQKTIPSHREENRRHIPRSEPGLRPCQG